jgi:hypothetical protein
MKIALDKYKKYASLNFATTFSHFENLVSLE